MAAVPKVAPTVKGAPLPKVLPVSNVGSFVMAFAEINGVKPTRTRLDLFAEAVTRLAGDEVKLDQVGQTLVALRERNLVSGAEMNTLFHNHILERNRGSMAAQVESDGVAGIMGGVVRSGN